MPRKLSRFTNKIRSRTRIVEPFYAYQLQFVHAFKMPFASTLRRIKSGFNIRARTDSNSNQEAGQTKANLLPQIYVRNGTPTK